MDRFKGLFAGRISRSNYFLSTTAIAIIALLLSGLVVKPLNHTVYGFVIGFIVLATWIIYSVSLEIRRWHDIGLTGWWSLTMIILPLQWVLFLLLCLIPGNKGQNKYGKQPKSIYF